VCRYYGLRANRPTRVEWHLVGAPNSLLVQSRRDLSGFEHADGWGIAAYDGDALQVQRRASAAHDGRLFCAAAERVEATTVLAHVRRATVGRVGLANTHPFVHGRFALVHNGTVPYFASIRPSLLDAMSPEHRTAIQGATDSEHLLHLILSIHAQLGGSLFACLEAALRRVLTLCHEIGQEPHLGLNVLLTDGERMVGSRWRRTLHFLEQSGTARPPSNERTEPATARDYRALFIASEPTNDGAWSEIPERSLFEVTPDLRLRIEPLGES
jgi:predicted glutamine amidotransferase